MSWKDRTYERTNEMMVYPFLQWVHDGGSMDPRGETGGFAMPTDQAVILGANIPGEVCALHHRGGSQTEVIFTTALEAAVLATRFTWIKDGQAIPAYEPGARGKLQALALVRDSGGDTVGPVLLTFKGYTSKQFGTALKEHRNVVRVATANKAPAYAFFGKYQAGGIEMVGNHQQSPVTTLVYGGDEFDPDGTYVGDDALDGIDWDQVDDWIDTWNQLGGNGSNGDDSKPAPPAPNGPNAPASAPQWKLIRKLLATLNYEGEERQNQAVEGAGYDPQSLTMGQASALIERLKKASK